MGCREGANNDPNLAYGSRDSCPAARGTLPSGNPLRRGLTRPRPESEYLSNPQPRVARGCFAAGPGSLPIARAGQT
jgi:hypothetical protein